MSEPPKFIDKESGQVSAELKALGIELSKQLPSYDVPMGIIEPNDWNTNEMSDAEFNRLTQEIEESNLVSAIQIVPAEGGKFRILGGENRWRAVQTLGWETIPCHILTDERFLDVDLQELLSVRLNVIHGKQNPEKFAKLYEKKALKYGVDQLQALFGYTSTDAWNKVTRGVEKALGDSGIGGDGLLAELKKRTKKVRSVDGLGRVLNKLFSEYGSDLKHSFMVFAHGNKRHLYVILSDEGMDSLDRIMGDCRKNDKDINDVLVSLFKTWRNKCVSDNSEG